MLLSIVIVMVAVPLAAARDSNLHRGLRKVVLLTIIFNLLYLLAVRYIYPRLQ